MTNIEPAASNASKAVESTLGADAMAIERQGRLSLRQAVAGHPLAAAGVAFLAGALMTLAVVVA